MSARVTGSILSAAAQVLDWIMQVGQKSWADDETLASLRLRGGGADASLANWVSYRGILTGGSSHVALRESRGALIPSTLERTIFHSTLLTLAPAHSSEPLRPRFRNVKQSSFSAGQVFSSPYLLYAIPDPFHWP